MSLVRPTSVRAYEGVIPDICMTTRRVTAKRKERRKAEEKTRKEEEHLDCKPLEGDKLKLTYGEATN